MKRILPYIVIPLVLLLTSCVETNIIDEKLILDVLGIDYIDDNNTKMIGNTPLFIKDEPVQNVVHKGISSADKHSIDVLQKNAVFEIKLGNLMVVLFDREFAEKKGIYGFSDYLKREPYVGARLYLAVVEGKTGPILDANHGERGNGFFIENLIQHNITKHDLPKNNLHLFFFDYYQKGKDPLLPIIKKIGPEKIQIDGMALFKDDKMVANVPNEKLFFLKLLVDDFTDGSFRMHESGKEIHYKHVKSKLKKRLQKRDPYEIDLHVKLRGTLSDYANGELDKDKIDKVEELIKDKIEKEVGQLIKKFQELQVDPAGIGTFVKSRTRNFDFEKWEDEYKETTFNVHAKVDIRDTGTIN